MNQYCRYCCHTCIAECDDIFCCANHMKKYPVSKAKRINNGKETDELNSDICIMELYRTSDGNYSILAILDSDGPHLVCGFKETKK